MAATLQSMLILMLLVLLTVWRADSSSLVGKHGDREALLAFKEALSDDSGSLRSWNDSSSDFCRWLGVTCSRRHPGRVVSLMLSYCNLGGIISPVIGNLTFLRELDKLGNMLSGDIPHTISRLHRLRSLQLGNNSLAGARDSVVAVKVFTLQQPGSSRSFLAECEALRQVKHRNLINIITCCSSIDSRGNDFQALVFDFMPRYSLDRWLHSRSNEQTHKSSLTQLLNIAIDVADALDYLHNSSCPTVIHCDLKPSNILLGSDWTAYVADFGLAKLIGESMDQSNLNVGTESTIGIRGTTGYIAPEYGAGGQATVAGDAYSFGVTLLEMFTGKAPTDDMFIEGLTLHLFAEAGLPDRISEIIDPELSLAELYDNDSEILSCLASVIRVGVSCSRDNPSERMNMEHAAAQLHRIKEYIGEIP